MWSRETLGNINEQVNLWEAKILIMEDMDLNSNTEHDRAELNKG